MCRLDGIGDRRADCVRALVQQLGRNSDRDGRLLPGENDLDLALPGRRLDFRLHKTTVHRIRGVEREGARQRGKKQEPEDMLVEPLEIGGPMQAPLLHGKVVDHRRPVRSTRPTNTHNHNIRAGK